MRKSQWKNVSGQLTFDFDANNPLRVDIDGVPDKGNVEMNFKSSGYSDPGRFGQDPDDSRAPEYDDERLPDGVATVYFHNADGKYVHIDLTPEQTDDLFEEYDEEVYDAELSFDAEPDYDYIERDY